MDFHSALETFAEAWLATNAPTPITTETGRPKSIESLPTMIPKPMDISTAGAVGLHGLNGPGVAMGQGAAVVHGAPMGQGDRRPSSSAPGGQPLPSSPKKEWSPFASQPPPTGKSIPIRCSVETSCSSEVGSSALGTPPDTGSSTSSSEEKYAIVPCTCRLSELVKTALQNLGYSTSQSAGATGFIQLNNWKPLSFNLITDSDTATVEDILMSVSSVATLKIKIPNSSSSEDVKDKLLQLLLSQSPDILRHTGCPITRESFETILRGGNDLPDSIKNAFYQWYQDRGATAAPPSTFRRQGSLPTIAPKPAPTQHAPSVTPIHRQQSLLHQQSLLSSQSKGVMPGSGQLSVGSGMSSSNVAGASSVPLSSSMSTPAGHTIGPLGPSSRSRLRISFDPDYEVPKLSRWFAECQHPSRQQMTAYLDELNGHPCRQNIKHLDLTNIMYWFKNARAAARRAGRALSHEPDGGDMSDEDVNVKVPGSLASMSGFGSGMSGCVGDEREGRLLSASSASVPELPNSNAIYMVGNPIVNRPSQEEDSDVEVDDNHRGINQDNDDEDDDAVDRPLTVDCGPENGTEHRSVDPRTSFNRPSSTGGEYGEQPARYASPTSRPHNAGSAPLPMRIQHQYVGHEAEDLSVKQEPIQRHERRPVGTNNNNNIGSDSEDEDMEDRRGNSKDDDDSGDSSLSTGGSPGPSPNGYCGYYNSQQLMAATAAASYPGIYPFLPAYLPTSRVTDSTVAAVSAALSAFTNKDAVVAQAAMAAQHLSGGGNAVSGGGISSGLSVPGLSVPGLSAKGRERQKRHRAFIDPVSEIPKLEQWFARETHPSHFLIDEICEELNQGEFRSRYPKLSPKNVQLWFKNHRAKVKRMRVGQGMGGFETSMCGDTAQSGFYKPETGMCGDPAQPGYYKPVANMASE